MPARPRPKIRRQWLALCVLLLAGCLAESVALAAEESRPEAERTLVAVIGAHAQAMTDSADDYDRLLASIGDARLVMLGEATHGSAEFYDQRARLTERLMVEKGFSALVLEAGWAPATGLDDFVHGRLQPPDTVNRWRAFQRFPRWVWRNEQFAAFLDQLRALNDESARERPLASVISPISPISVYGMDL